MINNVEILISSGPVNIYNILIDQNNNSCCINNKNYEINENIFKRILNIIVTWKYEYGYSNTLDAEEFTVIVNSNKKTTYHGKGIFPRNYKELLNIIGEIENGK